MTNEYKTIIGKDELQKRSDKSDAEVDRLTESLRRDEEEFEKYWRSTFEGMTDGDFIKYRNLGKSNAKTSFIKGIESERARSTVLIEVLESIGNGQHTYDHEDTANDALKSYRQNETEDNDDILYEHQLTNKAP